MSRPNHRPKLHHNEVAKREYESKSPFGRRVLLTEYTYPKRAAYNKKRNSMARKSRRINRQRGR